MRGELPEYKRDPAGIKPAARCDLEFFRFNHDIMNGKRMFRAGQVDEILNNCVIHVDRAC